MIDLKLKFLGNSTIIPKYAHDGDAGADLFATSKTLQGDIITYGTDLALEIPDGYVGLIFPRSSIYKKDLELCNSVGVIDSTYRGEIKLKFRLLQTSIDPNTYDVGDRIAQIVFVKFDQANFIESEELSQSRRGSDGFGSSGDSNQDIVRTIMQNHRGLDRE